MEFNEIKNSIEKILFNQIGKNFTAYQLSNIIEKQYPNIWENLINNQKKKHQSIPLFIANAMSYFTRNNLIQGLKQIELSPKYLNVNGYKISSSAKFVGAWQIVRNLQTNNATITNIEDYIKIILDVKNNRGNWSYCASKEENKDSEYLTSIKGKKTKLLSLKNYIDTLINIERDALDKRSHGISPNLFFFRGQSKCDYKLLPSVFRGSYYSNESHLFEEMTTSKPEIFIGKSKQDILTTMQHFGCPTRLLDVTTNPLIALYFACISHQDEDGKVYIFSASKNNLYYPESDTVSILANLATLNSIDKDRIFNEACKSLKDNKFKITNDKQFQNISLEKLFVKISSEKPGFKRELSPIDLLRPIIVKAAKSNYRIVKQDGLFILSGLSVSPEEAEFKLNLLSPFTIKITNKKELLKELDFLGINEASLFPDLDHISSYLKNQIKE